MADDRARLGHLDVAARVRSAGGACASILATPPGIADAGDAAAVSCRAAPSALVPSIEVRELTVERDGRKILDRVSFSLAAGDTLAIVGPTGSGKTTLVDAIPRLTDVPPGTIFVGGVDVTAIPLRALRSLIGYAPQEAFLFSATIAENIAFGAAGDDADRAAIERAARAAGLTRDIAAFHDGYDTVVGERGITLSGGQRQRVALARALCADPRILILDDSLSSVDAETEREILDPPAPDPGRAHVDPGLAPRGRGQGRRPDPGRRRRPHRRARHPRRAAGRGRRLRRALPRAARRRGGRGAGAGGMSGSEDIR